MSKPYKDARGYWTQAIELPSHDGTRRRKVVRRRDKKELAAEVQRLRAELATNGDLPTHSISVEQWFTYWLDKIAAKEVRPKTLAGYRSTTLTHIIPGLGPRMKLDKLTPTTVRKVHDRILAAGLSPTYALNAHRIMSASLEIALREGRVSRNVAKLVSPPRRQVVTLDVFSLEDARRFFLSLDWREDAEARRWLTSLFTGARRGEVIGLERDRVGDIIDLSWQLQRLAWSHGCGDRPPKGRPWACGFIRADSCPEKTLDVPHDYEYRRIEGGLYWTRPKSSAGWRIIPQFEPLRTVLEHHLAVTPENRWGLVFTMNGQPRDPDRDTAAWRDLMAGMFPGRSIRLHDVRHAAVDILYEVVPEDLIPAIIGHSTRAMSRAYRSGGITPRLQEALDRFGALFTQPALERMPGTGE